MAERAKTTRRGYRPEVEGLEALRLFHAAVPDALLADPAQLDRADLADTWPAEGLETLATPHDAWDAAIESAFAEEPGLDGSDVDPDDFNSGLNQLDRYLGRTWQRAGVAPSKHEDCTQAVYLSLLKSLGRSGFERLVRQVGDSGVRDALGRETDDGPTFLRAIDAAKKRAQRERSLPSLHDSSFEPFARGTGFDLHRTIGEAIERSLNAREAELIRSTLAGESPSEIAERWGVAPKTISNEKTRVLAKLRTFLAPATAHA